MEVVFKIQRFDPEKDQKPYSREYTVPDVDTNWCVLDVLNEIKWKQDGTLTYRRSCVHGVCGSDGIRINGKNRLACALLLKDIEYKKTVTIEPLPALPIIKDLVVDMQSFYDKYEIIKPYLINKNPPPERERIQSNEDAELLFESAKCILCACCTTSCPSFWTNKNYLGPASFIKTFRFVFDTRDEAADERLDIIDTHDGIWRCHTIFNCVEACPKKIDITWHISQLKKKLVAREF
jgi:succinate dehydrogenase / fumarate reductase iron-sulfur subunit